MLAPIRTGLLWLSLASTPFACSGSIIGMDPDHVAGAGGALAGAGGALAGAGEAGGASAVHVGIPSCESARVDPTSQLVVCANGFTHRAEPSECAPRATVGSGGASGSDGDSRAAAGAMVDPSMDYAAPCAHDADCPSGFACVCDQLDFLHDPTFDNGAPGACVSATCRTDADCGAGSYCAVGNLNYYGDALPGFSCLNADDECVTDADCDSSKWQICLQGSKRTCSRPPE
jgi:hypothetical protein